jgi:hypothetical protein
LDATSKSRFYGLRSGQSVAPIALLIVSVLLLPRSAFAQKCPHDGEVLHLTDDINRAASGYSIYRAAAIAGAELTPLLRRLSMPDMEAYSVPGAAQVSLAKIGDEVSLDEIKRELNNLRGDSIRKLQLVGTREAISTLMILLEEHISDRSLSRKFGDYTTDPRDDIVRGLG